jgi:hypothetical protein
MLGLVRKRQDILSRTVRIRLKPCCERWSWRLFVPKIALPHIDPLGQGTGRTLVSAAPPDIEILELVEIKARAFFQVGQRYLDGFGTFS